MRLQTIGDSHSVYGWRDVRCLPVVTNWLGAKLMHTFGTKGINTDILCVDKGDIVIFCFGEIDVRCHIKERVGDDYKKEIDRLVDNYFLAIRQVLEQMPYVWAGVMFVTPPARAGSTMPDLDFPFVGSDAERLVYTKFMNDKLKRGCLVNNMMFVDVYESYADRDGFLRDADNAVHIKDHKPLENFIKRAIRC